MGVLGWVALGLIAGLIARALHRGPEPAGLVGTLLVGVVGALLGGAVASAVGIGEIDTFFSLSSWLIATAGAFLVLLIHGVFVGRDRGAHGLRS